MKKLPVTPRTKIARVPTRTHYDLDVVHSILDDGNLCHLGFNLAGTTYVIPMLYGRIADNIYLHGANRSRMLMYAQEEDAELCFTVTHIDGIVLARSLFNHSLNYRSLMMLGKATLVTGVTEKLKALQSISDSLIKGRWKEARAPNKNELDATAVLKLPIKEVSTKVRTGPPLDNRKDIPLPIWAGVLPIKMTLGDPMRDPLQDTSIDLPDSIKNARARQAIRQKDS